MSALHPTKRDILLILSCFLLLGLFLQFDFSLRFTYSSGPRGEVDEKWENDVMSGSRIGGKGNGKGGDRYLSNVEAGVAMGQGGGVAGMAEAKVKWGEEGATRTEVLAHAPGMLSISEYRDMRLIFWIGWTVFDQIYLFNGTWFIVTENPSSIPLLRLMTSTGNEIWNDDDSIKGRWVILFQYCGNSGS
jgi:hypothetical protein